MDIDVWCDKIETTLPGDMYRTWRPGRKHASVTFGIPLWVARVLRRAKTGGLSSAARTAGSYPVNEGSSPSGHTNPRA